MWKIHITCAIKQYNNTNRSEHSSRLPCFSDLCKTDSDALLYNDANLENSYFWKWLSWFKQLLDC